MESDMVCGQYENTKLGYKMYLNCNVSNNLTKEFNFETNPTPSPKGEVVSCKRKGL